MSAYLSNLAVHVLDATYAGKRRLSSSGPGLLVRLGSFCCALASHRATAFVACGAGAWAVIYVGLRMVL